jgi:hypothetical protein
MHCPRLSQTSPGYTFPLTTCLFKCSDLCSNTTNHYCMQDDPSGLFMYDGWRICGKACCNICAVNCGYECTKYCPHCHTDSSIKLRRSPRKASSSNPPETLCTPSNSQVMSMLNGVVASIENIVRKKKPYNGRFLNTKFSRNHNHIT